MSKTYQALLKAEQLRAQQDPAALARRVAQLEEENEALRADLTALQEQLVDLVQRQEPPPAGDDDLGGRLTRIESQLQSLSTEPRRLAEETSQKLQQQLDRRSAEYEKQLHELAGVAELDRQFTALRDGLTPSIDRLAREFEELQRRTNALHESQQAAKQAHDEAIAAIREDTARALASAGEFQPGDRTAEESARAEAEQRNESLRLAQLAELRSSLEAVTARVEGAGEEQRTDAARIRSEQQAMHDTLRQTLVALQEESRAAATAAGGRIGELKAELDALRGQLADTIGSVDRVRASADQADRQARDTASAQGRGIEALQQKIGEIQSAGLALGEALASAQRSQTQDLSSAKAALSQAITSGLDELRSELVALREAQARFDGIHAAIAQAQITADDAGRRILVNEAIHRTDREEMMQQIDAIRTDSESWRDVSVGVQALLTQQQATEGELSSLRAELARLLEGQQRQQQLLEDLSVAPSPMGDRISDFGEPLDLLLLRRQVSALQAERLKMDAALEHRFEVLCGILDTQIQARLDELQGPSASTPPKVLTEAVARFASALPGLRKKPR